MITLLANALTVMVVAAVAVDCVIVATNQDTLLMNVLKKLKCNWMCPSAGELVSEVIYNCGRAAHLHFYKVTTLMFFI